MKGIINVLAVTPAKSGGGISSTLIFLIIGVVAVFFLMTRSNKRRQQQAQQKMSAVAPGARVRTTAGMYATVVSVDGDDVVLEVAPGVEVKYMKRAIMDVVPDEEPVTDFASAPTMEDVDDDTEDDTTEADEPEAAETDAATDGDVSAPGGVKKD
jgi:preprotein translocase subunit YajC